MENEESKVNTSDEPTLVAKTRELLKQRPVWMSYTRIETDTGLKSSWLNSFATKGHNPTADKLIKLYEYLTQSKITFA